MASHDDLTGDPLGFLAELEQSSASEATWHPFGRPDEVRRAGHLVRSLAGRRIGLLALDDGTFVAREMTCKHQGADLSAGPRRGSVLICPRHAWEYDLATGQCIHPAGGAPLRTFPVKEEEGKLWVAVG